MKTLSLLLFAVPTLAFSQTTDVTGGRHFTDANASINSTDIPRTLNANNSTNSTAGDWVSDSQAAKPVAKPNPVSNPENKSTGAKTTGKGSNNSENRVKSEGSANDNIKTVKPNTTGRKKK